MSETDQHREAVARGLHGSLSCSETHELSVWGPWGCMHWWEIQLRRDQRVVLQMQLLDNSIRVLSYDGSGKLLRTHQKLYEDPGLVAWLQFVVDYFGSGYWGDINVR